MKAVTGEQGVKILTLGPTFLEWWSSPVFHCLNCPVPKKAGTHLQLGGQRTYSNQGHTKGEAFTWQPCLMVLTPDIDTEMV